MPKLAASQNNTEKLKREFLNVFRLTLISTTIVYGFMVIFAPWIVELMFGSRFLSIASLVGLMGVYATLRPIGNMAGILAQATGKANREFFWNLYCWPMTIPFLIIVMLYYPTVEAFAINLSAIQIFISIIVYPLFLKHLDNFGFLKYIAIVLPVLLLSSLIAIFSPLLSLPPLTQYITILKLNFNSILVFINQLIA